jgi:hypothetical protein
VRRWIILSVVVTVVVAGAAVLGVRWYRSRGPSLGDVSPALQDGIAALLVAGGSDAAVTIDGVVRTRGCSRGPLRGGGIYTGGVEFYVSPGAEDALLSGIAARLPGATQAGGGVSASRGSGVAVSVRQLGDGWLVGTVATGCVSGPTQLTDTPVADSPPLDAVLEHLGTRPAALHRTTVVCPSGATAVTTAGISLPTASQNLAQRLPVPPGARAFPAPSANRVAYRDGAASIIIAASDDGAAITAQYTTSC